MKSLTTTTNINRLIHFIRGLKVMLDRDLAALYGVSTKVLNQAVKRHRDRFPADFMFQLTFQEADFLSSNSRSQFVTLNQGRNIKYRPYAFTEQGVAMLSSVLNSKRAIQVNIAIMREFVKLREVLATHKELARKLEDIERHLSDHDAVLGKHSAHIREVFEVIKKLMEQPAKPQRKIGFR